MRLLKHIANTFPGIVLGLLVLLLSAIGVRQDAAAIPAGKRHVTVSPHHGPAFHKMAAHKDVKHHPAGPTKHRKSRVHRPVVVKLAPPNVSDLDCIAFRYRESAPLPLARVYRYVFFQEITPPPPRGC